MIPNKNGALMSSGISQRLLGPQMKSPYFQVELAHTDQSQASYNAAK